MQGQNTSVLTTFNPADYGATKATSKNVPKPKTDAERFEEAALQQIEKLESTTQGEKLDWYRLRDDGKVDHVCLRNGVASMKIGEQTSYCLPGVESTIQFFRDAIQAAKEGQFDNEFARTRKVK
jgi:hypothetical protein